MMSKMRLSAGVSAVALLVSSTSAWAQEAQVPPAGQGTVGTGTPYPNEQVPVETAVQVEEAAAPDAPEEGVVVTGLRRSLQSAANIKRNSDAIVDAIVAEDIGKLPDTFASSALARVTGVTVTRGGGESAGVTVRGLPDISTTYNGREIFTAEGRFVQIQDFPAGTVAALEVFKSSPANLVEGGIGGQVNVRGRRPFDFKGFEMSGSVNGVHWEQAGENTWNGNLLVSDRWDTGLGEMGLLVNASYVGIDFLDSTREQALVIGTTNAGQGVPGGLRFPDAQALYYGGGKRNRPSLNAAFQWRPSSELEIYVDGLFQGYRGRDENRFLFVPIFGGLQFSNLVTRPNASDQVESVTVTNAVRPDGFYGSANGKTNTYQVGGGAIWKRDRLTVSADIARTDSTYRFTLLNIDHAFASSPVRNVSFDYGQDGGPRFEFVNFDASDPRNYISRGFYQEQLKVSGDDLQARTDLSYDMDAGFIKRLQFGLRYGDRDAGRDFGNNYVNNEGARIPLSALPVDLNQTNPGFDFNTDFPVRSFVGIPSTSIRDNAAELRTFFGRPAGLPPYNPLDTFRANEKSYAAYGQLKYGFDIGNTVVDGLIGVRAVKTKTTVNGFSRVEEGGGVVSFPEITAKNDYTDILPNISTRIAFTDKLQLRLAATKTRTRPNFFDLRPNTSLGQPIVLAPGDPCLTNPNTPDCQERLRRGGSAGNPNLKPLKSRNYDASLEYYFSRTGSVTAAVFRRNAEGFLTTVPDRSVPGLRIDRPINLGKTRFQGAEVSFTSFLDFEGVPEWARAFGLQANGTYIDAKGDVAFNDEDQTHPGVSKWAYNIVGLYEQPTFSARLAYNYRSKFPIYYSFEPFDPIPHPVVELGRGQLDFSTTMTPVPNVTFAFDVVNVLGNPLRRAREFNADGDSYIRQVIYLERTYSLGVRFRF